MIPKQRVLEAIRHGRPDRVPVNYSASITINQKLLAHFGLAAADQEGLLQALGVDFRYLAVPYIGPKIHPDVPNRKVDPELGIRTRWMENESGGYWDYCDFPLEHADLEQVEAWPLPNPDDYDYDSIPALCEKYGQYCIHWGNPGLVDAINKTAMLRGVEQVLVDLATDDEAGLRLLDRRLEVQLELTARVLEKAAGKVDLVWLGEDLGTQRGPLISRAMFDKHLRPRHQKFIDLAKSFNLPVMIHSCGSSSWAFDDFIDMGIDMVDTLQPEAKDMAPEYLKAKYGDKLAFHGCISTAGPLAYGSRQDVVDTVSQTLETMMPGGGYCLAPTHSIQDNSPVENVLAMYETARERGRY